MSNPSMSKKAKTVVELQAQSMIERIKDMQEKGLTDAVIMRQVAENLQLQVEAADRGSYVSLLNNGAKTGYQVKELMEIDITSPVEYNPGDAMAILRASVAATDRRIAEGVEMNAEQMETLNGMRAALTIFDKALAENRPVAEAEAVALGEANAQAALAASQSMAENENSWFVPKYMAAASALIGGGVAVFAGTKLSIGSAVGAVASAGVSYFAADYLFSKVATLNTLNPWLANAIASALGMGMGVAGARAGVMVEDRFFPTTASDDTTIETSVIPATSAEVAAYF